MADLLERLKAALADRYASHCTEGTPLPWLLQEAMMLKNSATRFVAPIMLVGFTALSVDIITKLSALYFDTLSMSFFVPMILFFTASIGLDSIRGTCLYAAA